MIECKDCKFWAHEFIKVEGGKEHPWGVCTLATTTEINPNLDTNPKAAFAWAIHGDFGVLVTLNSFGCNQGEEENNESVG